MSLNKYQYAYDNPFRYIDPDGHDVHEYVLLVEGPNQAPKAPHHEVRDASQLGPHDTPVGGYFVLNLKVTFDNGDHASDYEPLRSAMVPGEGAFRQGSGRPGENPGKENTVNTGQTQIIFDEPGQGASGGPKASAEGLANKTFLQTFVAGEFNKKTKELSSNVAYYILLLVFDKNGNIDKSKSFAKQITRDQYITITQKYQKLPKDKKGKPCPECTLVR